jgi:hypothetical protein
MGAKEDTESAGQKPAARADSLAMNRIYALKTHTHTHTHTRTHAHARTHARTQHTHTLLHSKLPNHRATWLIRL